MDPNQDSEQGLGGGDIYAYGLHVGCATQYVLVSCMHWMFVTAMCMCDVQDRGCAGGAAAP